MRCLVAGALGVWLALGLRRAARSRRLLGRIGCAVIDAGGVVIRAGEWLVPDCEVPEGLDADLVAAISDRRARRGFEAIYSQLQRANEYRGP